MQRMSPAARLPAALAALALVAALTGCGKSNSRSSASAGGGPSRRLAPLTPQGAVTVTTRNTTRLGGTDPVIDAASIARVVYPGLTKASRPQAVVLVDVRNWSAALAASSLSSAPLNAPILYSEGKELPEVTKDTLEALHPTGAKAFGGAQVIKVGATAAVPRGYRVDSVPAGEPSVTAEGVEQVLASAGGKPPTQVIVVSATAPSAELMPTAGLAAESAVPILYVSRSRVPDPTAAVLVALGHPSIYVVDPSGVSPLTMHELAHYGTVTSIVPTLGEQADPVTNSLAVARFTDGSFGWGIKEPGHGLVFANQARPLDAPPAAILSATGDYGPLLLLESAYSLPEPLTKYLKDIEPAYSATVRPVRAVYNHGWLIGDERAISAVTQAELDSLLEISQEAPEEQSNSPVE